MTEAIVPAIEANDRYPTARPPWSPDRRSIQMSPMSSGTAESERQIKAIVKQSRSARTGAS